jgi:hypothetical protein
MRCSTPLSLTYEFPGNAATGKAKRFQRTACHTGHLARSTRERPRLSSYDALLQQRHQHIFNPDPAIDV